MVKRAVIVGINYYDHPNMSLRGCINDAYNIRQHLIDRRGYTLADLTLLTDEYTNRRTNRYPTRDNIIAAISQAVTKTKSEDTLFIHISSHGTSVTDHNGDERDGKDEAMVSADNKLIIDDEFKEFLVNKMPAGSKLRVLMDLCHSGTALDLPYNWRQGGFTKESAEVDGSHDCIMLSGTYDAHVSYDAKIGGDFSGVFTHHIVKILSTAKPTLTWKELLETLCSRIEKAKFDQIPQLSMGSKELLTMPVDL